MTDNMREFVKFLIMGVVSKGSIGEKTPVGYSYNGVVLPKLPEWDKETYPYAYFYLYNGRYVFIAKDRAAVYGWITVDGEEIRKVYSTYAAGETITIQRAYCENGAWTTPTVVYFENTATGSGSYTLRSETSPLWANFNIIDKDDGTTYLAASDPVPVYE